MARNLLILDGHNLLWKAYGVPFKFHSEKGMPLHVATAFLSLVRRAVKVVGKCTEIAIVFDSDQKNSNHALSVDYKANRKTDYSQDEDSPFHHMPQVLRALTHLKIKIYMRSGVEADDIVASLTAQYLKQYKNSRVFIASTDSDFYQLLSPRVNIITYGKKGADTLFTAKSMKEKLGVAPRQYVYFKSLTGDKADNIGGIPGVGKVRAEKIVNRSLKFDAKPYAELMHRNQKLITLNQNLNICKNWKLLALRPTVLALKSQEVFDRAGL